MRIRMVESRGWRGARLLAGGIYQLHNAAAQMLINDGYAISLEYGDSEPVETRTAKPKRTRRPAKKAKK